ncbi:plasmid partition protein ParG [Calothrix sp. UHCC 0171]|uniref:plasmid partition protein ParG n=1 Tax=Calothrix sp. UHCC 0171 TaxID=3110245 RepID=UPI002B202166|nr:plasmid partition protein ParG [Calothrix sp. UHCC 0171]MEA5571248.1 plasmid partition protein ParG [Calothrix sp. UHCC 0171]
MSGKKRASRFDDLIDAARSRQQRDDLPSVEGKVDVKSKSTDPNYIRTTVYLPKQLHKRMKAAALLQDKQMSDVIAELVEQWLLTQS